MFGRNSKMGKEAKSKMSKTAKSAEASKEAKGCGSKSGSAKDCK